MGQPVPTKEPAMPTLGLTLGDPCGIGPELWVQILCAESAAASSHAAPHEPGPALRLYGDVGVLAQNGAAAAPVRRLAAPCQQRHRAGHFSHQPDRRAVAPRSADVCQRSRAGGLYQDAVIADAARGQVQGLVTGPIHKASAKAAGLSFPGDTPSFWRTGYQAMVRW